MDDQDAAGVGDVPESLNPELAIAMRNLASAMPLTRAKGMQVLARYFTEAINTVAHEAIRQQVYAARQPRHVIDVEKVNWKERAQVETMQRGSNWREIGTALGMSHTHAKRLYGEGAPLDDDPSLPEPTSSSPR